MNIGSEVDPTGSLWYMNYGTVPADSWVLKLTLPGHYGIIARTCKTSYSRSEVDPTGSLWYMGDDEVDALAQF